MSASAINLVSSLRYASEPTPSPLLVMALAALRCAVPRALAVAAILLVLQGAQADERSRTRSTPLKKLSSNGPPLTDGAPRELTGCNGHSVPRKVDRSAIYTTRGGSTFSIDKFKIPAAFFMWYAMSIVYSILNKQVLTIWNFPCAFSAAQLLVGGLWISLLWLPLRLPWKKATVHLRSPPQLTWEEQRKLLTVSSFLALGHLLSTVAPAYGTVAFTNVVKTAEPLFTCVFSAVILGQTFSLPVYLTLIPVIAGVCLATANEVSFSMISLVSGLLSNVCFAMRAITAKRVMQKPVGSNLTAQNLYGVLTLQALAVLLPFALIVEGPGLIKGTTETIRNVGGAKFAKMLLCTGVSHYLYNECAFLALSSVHPVTHAVANTVKRIAVIVLSVLYFRDPLTMTGGLGSAIAIVGVLLYSIAKSQC